MFAKRPKNTDCEDDLLVQQNLLISPNQERDFKLDNVIDKVPIVQKSCTKSKVGKEKKMSIFAKRRMEAQSKHGDCSPVIEPKTEDGMTSAEYKQETTSKEESFSNSKSDEWNLFEQVIAKHSTEELVEEMKMIQNKVGPNIIAFLKNRSKNKQKVAVSPVSDSNEISSAIHKTDLQKINKNECTKDDVIKSDENELNNNEQKSASNTKLATRFGLCGEIILEEDDGFGAELYHHDEEPERGGYTLQELFSLVRSSFNQQQDFGLRMLSCIVKQAKLGTFHGRISNGIIPVLVGGDVGTLVRFALDSSAQSTIASAVEFLHALLVNTEDEVALDYVFTWHRGYEQPAMNATNEDFASIQSEGNESLKVEDVLKLDLVEGLLKMIILPRISALLSFFQSQPIVVNHLLDIVIRISRHHDTNHEHNKSQSTCDYPEYLGNIVRMFLPLNKDNTTQMSHSKVIKLLRVLASSDISTAMDVLDKYGDNVFQYLHVNSETGLYFESMRFFIVMLRYKLAFDTFQSNIAFISSRLSALSSSDLLNSDDSSTEISLLLSITEAGINSLPDNYDRIDDDLSRGSSQELLSLVDICFTICKKHLNEFVSKYYIQKYTVSTVLASSLNCIATCFDKFQDRLQVQALEFMTQTFRPCLDSMSFERAVGFLRENSSIIPNVVAFESLRESCASFKTLESFWVDQSYFPQQISREKPVNKNMRLVSSHLEVRHMEQVFPSESSSVPSHICSPSPMCPSYIRWHPIIHPLSTTPFLVAMARMILVLSKISVDRVEILKKVLDHQEIRLYLSKFISGQNISPLHHDWFSRFETHFVYLLSSMSEQLLGDSENSLDSLLYHRVAINLMAYLHQGDEGIASLLITNAIFNKNFLKDVFHGSVEEAAERFQTNFIVDTKRSQSIDFGNDILRNLSDMGDAFVEICFNGEDLKHSRNVFQGHATRCMMVGMCDKTIMRNDWLLEPLRHIYSLTNQSKKNPELFEVVKHMEKHCSHSLRAFLLFEKVRPEVLQHLPTELKFSRIVQAVIAAGEDIEMDATCSYLDQLLEVYGRSQKKSQHLLSKVLYDSFLDLYLQHLGPVPIFQFMVLLPLMLFDGDNSLWQLLWSTRSEVARFFSLKFNQIPGDVSTLLRPKDENDLTLIKIFYHFLRMNYITHEKTPVPYLIAIHNINHFMFSSEKLKAEDRKELPEAELFQKICAQKANSWPEPLRTHALLYKCMNLKNSLGFEMYEALPAHRQKHFFKLINTVI